MDACKDAVKLNKIIGCRQSAASIVCRTNSCIKNVSIANNYFIKSKIDAEIYAKKTKVIIGGRPGRQSDEGNSINAYLETKILQY